MPSPKIRESLIPATVSAQLLAELDTLFGQTARGICQLDVESGVLSDCIPQAELLRRLAVVVRASEIIHLMEDALLRKAGADAMITQVQIGQAMRLTQQGVAYRLSRL